MLTIIRSVLIFLCVSLLAQEAVFVCPMDPEVRSASPGKCPRCGMTLVANLPEPIEYPMEFRAEPKRIPAQEPVTLEFRILDPKTRQPVTHFNTVHEKLFHLFLVSHDLTCFSHEHPHLEPDGWFQLKTRLPKAGTYRLLADFDPVGGTPQLAAETFSTEGFTEPLEASIPKLSPSLTPQKGDNVTVQLTTDPPEPIAGRKTMISLDIQPVNGLEKYIGAWAHVLAVSDDMLDMIHTHPTVADGGPKMQIDLFFPRARTYRIWIQLQRQGVVNTVAFNVPVRGL